METDVREAPVYAEGSRCGTVRLRRDGLYWRLECACGAGSGLLRLYADAGGEPIPCGVLQPERGALRLTRYLAASAFPGERAAAFAAAVSLEEAWTPWSGMALDLPAENVLAVRKGETARIALPLGEDGSFGWTPLLCLCAPVRIGGRWYLTIQTGENCNILSLHSPDPVAKIT